MTDRDLFSQAIEMITDLLYVISEVKDAQDTYTASQKQTIESAKTFVQTLTGRLSQRINKEDKATLSALVSSSLGQSHGIIDVLKESPGKWVVFDYDIRCLYNPDGSYLILVRRRGDCDFVVSLYDQSRR